MATITNVMFKIFQKVNVEKLLSILFKESAIERILKHRFFTFGTTLVDLFIENE